MQLTVKVGHFLTLSYLFSSVKLRSVFLLTVSCVLASLFVTKKLLGPHKIKTGSTPFAALND